MSAVFHPYLMLLVFCVFIALIFFLNLWLYRPILGFIKKRDESLKSAQSALNKNQEKAKEIQIEIQKLLFDAKQEAKEIKDQAMQEAQKKYNESFERAKNELELRFNEQKEILITQQKMLQKKLIEEIHSFETLIQNKITQGRSIQ